MESRVVPLYLPEGVGKVIGFGSSSFIGLLDHKTVLKYPRVVGEQWDRFVIEERMYNALGSHPRIIACFGLDERGLKLEYAIKGTVRDFLRDPKSACSITSRDRLKWSRQATEGLAYIHTKNIIHCDISTRNFLLDKNLDVKISDFQGIYMDPYGVVFNGFALENAKSYLPRPTTFSDEKSDLFALGSAIYEIMTGHEPFPELNELDDEEDIERRYMEGRFPALDDVMGEYIVYKCWSLAYREVNACAKELRALEECSTTEYIR